MRWGCLGPPLALALALALALVLVLVLVLALVLGPPLGERGSWGR